MVRQTIAQPRSSGFCLAVFGFLVIGMSIGSWGLCPSTRAENSPEPQSTSAQTTQPSTEEPGNAQDLGVVVPNADILLKQPVYPNQPIGGSDPSQDSLIQTPIVIPRPEQGDDQPVKVQLNIPL